MSYSAYGYIYPTVGDQVHSGYILPRSQRGVVSKSCVDDLLLLGFAEHIGSFNTCLLARRELPQSPQLTGQANAGRIGHQQYHAVIDLAYKKLPMNGYS